MQPPIFAVCAADSGVQAVLGLSPAHLYPFAEAPHNAETPYAVWQIVTGSPDNYITGPPDIDRYTVQVDVYAKTGSEAASVAEALRDAIEPHAHIVRWGGHDTDPDTRHRHISFDVSWFVPR